MSIVTPYSPLAIDTPPSTQPPVKTPQGDVLEDYLSKIQDPILYELKFSRWFYFREFRESNPREKFMSIYSNDNISKIAKLTTRELPHLAKTAKITTRN